MVEIRVLYEGALRCRAVHGPSGAELGTDAPVDNRGKGASFSPTDLVGTAMGTCMLTIMGIAAEEHGWDMTGASARVVKHMVADPRRRIGKLAVVLALPSGLPAEARPVLERAAHGCPVHASLRPEVEVELRFAWGTS